MPERPTLIYAFDGSFEGLLCCVFESFEKRELPMDVLPEGEPLPLLLEVRTIGTDAQRAQRVKVSIPKKMGKNAMHFIRRAFLTCHPQKDLLIFKFLLLGYKYGPSVMNRLADDTVHSLYTAVHYLENESHLYREFIRFSEANGALTAVIEPKNIVLPLIADHFCDRFPNEQFLIYDKTHGMALIYQSHQRGIYAVEDLELPQPGEEEMRFRALWRLFYDTIEIRERRNYRCRMSHMPKRYWRCMTEFAREEQGCKKSFAALPKPENP